MIKRAWKPTNVNTRCRKLVAQKSRKAVRLERVGLYRKGWRVYER